jgi:hypothetical protein
MRSPSIWTVTPVDPVVGGREPLPKFEDASYCPELIRLARPQTDLNVFSKIAADAGLAGTHLEDSESPKFDTFTPIQGFLDAFKDGFDYLLCFGLRKARLVDDI